MKNNPYRNQLKVWADDELEDFIQQASSSRGLGTSPFIRMILIEEMNRQKQLRAEGDALEGARKTA